MPTFLWEGKTAQGKGMKGELEAPSLEAVFALLRDRRIRPVASRIREKGTGLERELKIPGFGERVKPKEVSLFTRQFATNQLLILIVIWVGTGRAFPMLPYSSAKTGMTKIKSMATTITATARIVVG